MPQVPNTVTRPDVAALTHQVISSCIATVDVLTTLSSGRTEPAITLRSFRLDAVSVSELAQLLVATIDRSRPQPARDLQVITSEALIEHVVTPFETAFADSVAELALRSGHSPDVVRSAPVRRALLRRHRGRVRSARLLELCERLDTLAVQQQQLTTQLTARFADIWSEPGPHGGFDAVVAQHGSVCDSSAVAWAVIGFESQRHVNLVWHQANKLERLFPDRDAADMLALGWMGLRTALRLYDPTLGFSFSTYAVTRITGAIRDGVRAENPVPKRLGTFGRKVAAAEETLAHSLGRAPTLDEVAEHLGVTLDELKIIPRLQAAASIEELETAAAERGGPSSWIVDDTNPADVAVTNLRRDAVEHALSRLDPRDAAAVRLLVMEGLRPAEAQTITGEAPRKLRARRERALDALRDELSGWHDGRFD